jgi:ABC-type uncharacterized transport system permease subunit
MKSARSQLVAEPLVPRFAIVGLTVAGVLGGLVGLVLGLRAHPATAWFAVVEVGVPAAVAGAVLGALVGVLTVAVQKTIHR